MTDVFKNNRLIGKITASLDSRAALNMLSSKMSCPRRTRSCLDARHGSEQNRTEDIDGDNPDWQRYEVEMEEQIRRDIMKEFAPALKNKSDQSTYFTASKPVQITVNKRANPVHVHVANKRPAGMHQDCYNLINRLLGKIE